MPNQATIEQFIARVEANAHAAAIEEFYTEDASMRENHGKPRIGRDALVANERKVLSRVKKLESTCVRPIFVNDDKVVIRWVFMFEWLDGSTTKIEELTYQRWVGERIAEEQFFYDPAQMTPKPP